MDPILVGLAKRAGIHFPAGARLVAMDAQPALITTSNAGIPAFLSTLVDPKIIKILLAPMRAAQIVGDEVKKGDWTTKTAMFLVVESTGEVSSYDDYSENGKVGANSNFPSRQSYHYQVISQYGEMELETAGLARLDWASQVNEASVGTLNRFQNKSYFFGVKGLELYGLLNDPNLIAPIAPTSESGNVTWAEKDALGVLADIAALFTQLQNQTFGNVDLRTKMTLALSPLMESVGMTKTNNFNVNVFDLMKKNYPNMTVETAVEYSTDAGELVQLIAPEIEGQRTASCAFTEKLRAHPIVVGMSSWKQKKSQGTWGTVIFRPMGIAQMLGIG